jgi:hypothetical protein
MADYILFLGHFGIWLYCLPQGTGIDSSVLFGCTVSLKGLVSTVQFYLALLSPARDWYRQFCFIWLYCLLQGTGIDSSVLFGSDVSLKGLVSTVQPYFLLKRKTNNDQ